jgi:serine/threonine-protein kinase RsbW
VEARREQRSWTWPARPESVPVARRVATGTAAELGADPGCLDDLALAVSEACTNVVIHAYRNLEGDARSAEFEVEVDRDEDSVRVLVTDHGCGMLPRTDSPGLGLGLPLIARMTKSMQVLPAPGEPGTTLCMAFPVAG